MLRYTTDRARLGLVALYDIRPGNGVGQFLQPRSPHGAIRPVNLASAISKGFSIVDLWGPHISWNDHQKTGQLAKTKSGSKVEKYMLTHLKGVNLRLAGHHKHAAGNAFALHIQSHR